MPKSRVIAAGLLMAALVIGVAVPGGADDLATAKSRQKKMQAALDDATRELDQIESERSFAEQRLQAANSRLGYVRDDLAAARRALSGHVSSLYKAGGTRPLSGILGSSADVVVSRVEFETILQEGQVAAVADAKVAYDSYEAAIKDVKAAMAQMSRLEARSKATVGQADPQLREGQAGRGQAGRVQHHPPGERALRVLPGVQALLVHRLLGRRPLRRPGPQGDRHHEPHGQQGPRHRRRGRQPAVDQLAGRHQPLHAGRRRQRVLLRPPLPVRLA